VSEEQTWRSEDAECSVSKSFLVPARRLHLLNAVTHGTDSCRLSEAECIVFAAEGLFLARGFPFNCGIPVEETFFLAHEFRICQKTGGLQLRNRNAREIFSAEKGK
jgi:hypothetical protein